MNNCVFCAELIPNETIQEKLKNSYSFFYICMCGIEYTMVEHDKEPRVYRIYTKYKDYLYEASFYLKTTAHSSDNVLFYLSKWTDNELKVIMCLDYHPDITPNNFLSKLPTLITFS